MRQFGISRVKFREMERDYYWCGVDFISVGALTHSVLNFDLSLKAI
jgi:nicotinate-nucleotide pyrophosphorylase